MKEQDDKLTLQETEQLCRLYMDCSLSVFEETEQLCRLYMDCRLSVHEETELQYVLGKLSYSSPCIDEVRMLMWTKISKEKPKSSKINPGFWRSRSVISIAASFTILLVFGIALFRNQSMNEQSSSEMYIAYADGRKVSKEQTVRQVVADMKTAEEFLNHIEELESQEQRMVDNFINQISTEQEASNNISDFADFIAHCDGYPSSSCCRATV